MSKNPHGGISRKSTSREWGSKARKHETNERSLNKRAADEAIAEQAEAMVDCAVTGGTHTWRYEDSRDAFRCVACNVWESAD